MVNLVKRGESWYSDVYLPSTGKRIRKSLGKITREEAERIIQELAEEYSRLENGYTLEDLLRLYENEDTNPRYKSAKVTGAMYGEEHAHSVALNVKFIRSAIASNYPKLLGKPIKEITRVDASHMRQAIYNAYGATRGAQARFVALKSMFTQSLQEGWITANPCAMMKDISYKKKKRFSVEAGTIRKILSMGSQIEDKRSYLEWAYFAVLATTGMRLSELLALKKSQIYQGTVTVDSAVKNKKGKIDLPKWNVVRVFPLAEVTKGILESIAPEKDGRYFARKRNWASDAIIHVRNAAMVLFPEDAEEIGKITAHVLRHSLNTILLSEGLPEVFISEYTGWEHQHMLIMQQNYTHLKAKHLEPVARQIDEIFG